MRLSELVYGGNLEVARNLPETEISGLSADSRTVRPGFLFAALPGSVEDGRRYIDQAIENGAVAILTPDPAPSDHVGGRVPVVTDANPRRRLAQMASRFYGGQPELIAAVTGTNGKTSVASFLCQIWALDGYNAAAMGTLGVTGPGRKGGSGLTTPDPVKLHEALAGLKQEGVQRLALEASSHGLDQYRLDGVRLKAAAFTNLSRDHLDYHASMDEYRNAKLRLFRELLPAGAVAVTDAESPQYEDIAAITGQRNLKLVTFGRQLGDIRCLSAVPHDGKWSLSIDAFGGRFDLEFPLPGEFQISNALCALALATGCGAAPDHTVPMLSRLEGVPGRMQLAGRLRNGASVIVDYAHTPGALSTVLQAARAHVTGRLVVVFGCGGDRDAGKRPEMGAAAARFADRAIVTDDNPRSEDPSIIRRQALEACPDAEEIGDRGAAIAAAVESLEQGDVLVIAGKGHEQGQIVAGKVLPFDDISVARNAIARRDGVSS